MPVARKITLRTWLLVILIGFPSAHIFAAQPTPTIDWTIVPGQRFGPISLNTSEDKLRELFGAGNVHRENIGVGEGETEPGTVVFPNTTRTLNVFWLDATTRDRIKEIHINGDKSVWKTDKGITLGTALKQLEKLNGRPFSLMGFAWDYAGTIVDCNGGRLKELGCVNPNDSARVLRGRTLLLRLAPTKSVENEMTASERKAYKEVMGETVFSSAHPAMQRINPQVYTMIASFTP